MKKMLTLKNFNKRLQPISNLTAMPYNGQISLTWTDPSDAGDITWASTKLVRKTGSAPTTSSDGTLVLTETTKNQYSSNGYMDTGLTNGTTYYYKAFSVDNSGNETMSSYSASIVTPSQNRVVTGDSGGYYDSERYQTFVGAFESSGTLVRALTETGITEDVTTAISDALTNAGVTVGAEVSQQMVYIDNIITGNTLVIDSQIIQAETTYTNNIGVFIPFDEEGNPVDADFSDCCVGEMTTVGIDYQIPVSFYKKRYSLGAVGVYVMFGIESH